MRRHWAGWPHVLWGAVIGLATGVGEACVTALGASNPSEFRRVALLHFFQLGFAWPAFGAAVGYIVFNRRRMREEKRRSAGQCGRCGYNLTGNVSGVCPECGGKM